MNINADSQLTYINFIIFYIFQNIVVVLYTVYPYLVEFEKFMCVVDGIDALDLAGKTLSQKGVQMNTSPFIYIQY